MKKETLKLENNHALASAVLEHFQLTPEEIRLLQGTPKDLTVEDGFYAALDRLKKIHDDCKYLVSSRHFASPPSMIRGQIFDLNFNIVETQKLKLIRDQ